MKLKHITEQQVATRTLHTFGEVEPNTIADVYVDGKLCHTGLVSDGVIFNFTTDVQKHGSVSITINVLQGSIVLTHNRVTYPAIVKGKAGYVNMPQPIVQPNLGIIITGTVTYNHYMFNGPTQWIVENPNSNDATQVTDDFYEAVARRWMIPDWQYDNHPVDIDNLSYKNLI